MKKLFLSLLLLMHGFVSAAIFQVNLTVQDHVDDNPGDGVCDIPSGGFCTLRAAVMEANALPGADTIVLPGNSNVRLSINGAGENAAATGDLDITSPVVIGTFVEPTEDFPTIDASLLNDRIFHVLSGSGAVTFVNVRMVNGSADFSNGGAINISTANQVQVDRVWFEDNTADSGGAIYISPLSELTVIDSVFKGNAAVTQGAALTIFGTTDIDKATIYENLNFNGGFKEAVYVGFDQFGTSYLTLRNSTVFNNSNSGIYGFGGDVSIRNSTIALNSERGIISNPDGKQNPELRIRNSVFNQNGVTDCAAGGTVDVIADNWNIASDNSSCFQLGTTNLVETDPKLTVIKTDSENWHSYFRPGFYSPIVDSAHPTTPGPGIGCEAEDQRGVARAQDGNHDGTARCDRGAIELLEDVIFYDDFDIAY